MILKYFLFFSVVLILSWFLVFFKFLYTNRRYIFSVILRNKFYFLIVLFLFGFFFIFFNFYYASEIWTHSYQAACLSGYDTGVLCNSFIYGSDHELIMPIFLSVFYFIFGYSVISIKIFFTFVFTCLSLILFFLGVLKKFSRINSLFFSLLSVVPFSVVFSGPTSMSFGFIFILLFLLVFFNRNYFKNSFSFLLFTLIFLIFIRVDFVFLTLPFFVSLFFTDIIKFDFRRIIILFLLGFFVFTNFILFSTLRTLSLTTRLNYLIFVPLIIIIFFTGRIYTKNKLWSYFCFGLLVLLVVIYFIFSNYAQEYSLWNVLFYKLVIWIKALFNRYFYFAVFSIIFIFYCMKRNNYSKLSLLSWLLFYYSYSVLEHNFVDYRFLVWLVFLLLTFILMFIDNSLFIRKFIFIIVLLFVLFQFRYISSDDTCSFNSLSEDLEERYLPRVVLGVNSYEFLSLTYSENIVGSYGFLLYDFNRITNVSNFYMYVPTGECDSLYKGFEDDLYSHLDNREITYFNSTRFFDIYYVD